MDDDIESLRQEVQHLIAMNTASYVAITSLVATHPDPQQLRSYQEALKNALDRANNNLNFVQAAPCPFTY